MRSLFVICATVAFGAGAFAQEVYVDGDVPNAGGTVEMYSDDTAVAVPPDHSDVRVYGWRELRPDDCGTFKYWNGEYCADARDEPARAPAE